MDQNVGYQNLASQLQAIQSQSDIYKGGSPLDASRHINNIATTLSKDYGVTKLSDIGVTLGVIPKFADTVVQERGKAPYRVQTYDVGPDGIPRWNQNSVARGFTPGQPVQQNMLDYKYYNKNTNQEIPANKFASEGEGEGYSNYNLQAVPDGKGGFAAIPVQEYSQSGFKEVATDLSPYVAVAALALQAVPGVGQAVGAAVLGGSAATAAATVGLTVSQITAAVGAATIAAGTTALQGGNAEDVLKAGLSAGAALGVNFAAGGGITGAAAGSVAGTAIKGGNASQVLTNAFAAGVGAGVQGALPDNPDAGKILGSAARTYIATGGNMDQTLLNTAATAIGTLNQPSKTAQQLQAASTPAKVSQDLIQPFEEGGLRYEEQPDGTAKVTDQFGNEKIISSSDFSKIVNAPFEAPATDLSAGRTELASQTVTAPSPVVSPTVTDLDLVKQVGEQPTSTVDLKELERVIVQGQKETANTAPVVTDIAEVRPDTTRGLPVPTAELPPVTVTGKREEDISPTVTELPPVTVTGERDPTVELPPVTVTGQREPTVELDPVTITGKREYELDPVTITGKREEEVAPTVTELDPVTIVGKRDPIYELDPVTITGKREYELDPVTITGKKEDDVILDDTTPPKEEEKETEKEKPKGETKKIYPTVTSVPPPKRPRAPPIITGASPARLLADALAAYRPAGEIEGEESGKERQNVWNEKSLRLKDALGL